MVSSLAHSICRPIYYSRSHDALVNLDNWARLSAWPCLSSESCHVVRRPDDYSRREVSVLVRHEVDCKYRWKIYHVERRGNTSYVDLILKFRFTSGCLLGESYESRGTEVGGGGGCYNCPLTYVAYPSICNLLIMEYLFENVAHIPAVRPAQKPTLPNWGYLGFQGSIVAHEVRFCPWYPKSLCSSNMAVELTGQLMVLHSQSNL